MPPKQQADQQSQAINAFHLNDGHLKAIVRGLWVPNVPVDFVVRDVDDVAVKLRIFPDGTSQELPLE